MSGSDATTPDPAGSDQARSQPPPGDSDRAREERDAGARRPGELDVTHALRNGGTVLDRLARRRQELDATPTAELTLIQRSNRRIALARRHAAERAELAARHQLELIDAGFATTPCCGVAYQQRPGDPRGPVKRVDYCPDCSAALLLDGRPATANDCPECNGELRVIAHDPRSEVTHTGCEHCDHEDIG